MVIKKIKMKIVVTIPAYNEADSIGFVIDSIKKVMKGTSYKILVVDDCSTDNTKSIALKHGAIVYSHIVRRGLAATFNTEIKKCLELNADFIIHIDADGQYLASEIPILLNEVNNGYDLVLGSRFMGTIEYMPILKKLGNKSFSYIVSKITNLNISDAQTGFRAFSKEVAQRIKITSNYTYTQEQIIKSVRDNYKIKEVPVYFRKRKKGESRLMKNSLHYAIRAGVNLIRVYRDYRPMGFFLGIGSVFIVLGFTISLYLLYSFLKIGLVKHIPLTILSIFLIIIGFQIVIFGFLADMIRK